MQLPKDKTPVKVTYTYQDGSEYYLDEENSQTFNKNIEVVSINHVLHGGKFQTLKWKTKSQH